MCETSAFTRRYHARVGKLICVTCRKPLNDSRRKCFTCRTYENTWRKNTRTRRVEQERLYKQRTWAKRMVMHAKLADTKYNRPINPQEYITPKRIEYLRKLQHNQCFYCKTELQNTNRRLHDGLSLERLSSALPHTQHNCVLACHRCTCRRLDRLNKDNTSLSIFHNLFLAYKQNARARSDPTLTGHNPINA